MTGGSDEQWRTLRCTGCRHTCKSQRVNLWPRRCMRAEPPQKSVWTLCCRETSFNRCLRNLMRQILVFDWFCEQSRFIHWYECLDMHLSGNRPWSWECLNKICNICNFMRIYGVQHVCKFLYECLDMHLSGNRPWSWECLNKICNICNFMRIYFLN